MLISHTWRHLCQRQPFPRSVRLFPIEFSTPTPGIYPDRDEIWGLLCPLFTNVTITFLSDDQLRWSVINVLGDWSDPSTVLFFELRSSLNVSLYGVASTKDGCPWSFFPYYFHSNCVSVWRSGALISTEALVWWLHEKVCVTCDPPRVYSCLFLRGCWEYNDTVLVGRVECGWCLASSFCLCLLRQLGVSSSQTQGPNPLVIHPALVESACPRSVPLSAPVLSGKGKKRSHPIMKGCLTI